MKLLIINGSPHGEKGNTGIFITQFVKGMKEIPMVSCIQKENPEVIAEKIKKFDTVLIDCNAPLCTCNAGTGNETI